MKVKKDRRYCRNLILVGIVLLITSISIVSCNNSYIPDYDTEDDIELSDEIGPKTEYLPIRVTGDLHDSVVLEHGAKTKHGYYEVISWPPDMLPQSEGETLYGNIVYTDYDTCRRVYLCNVPGCAHNTPDCTSFVSYSGSWTLFTDYSERHLYFVSRGRHLRDISSTDLATIIEMDMDGSDRRIVCKLQANESFRTNTVIVASDEYVYATTTHAGFVDNGPIDQYVLERIWFADGRREVVCPLLNNYEKHETLLSVWGTEELIISEHVTGDEHERGVYRCRVSQDGELIERFSPEGTFGYYSNKYRITGNELEHKATVTAIDYETDKRITIENVPAETRSPGRIVIYVRDGNRINWTFLDENGKNRDYILDFSDGSIKELTLRQRNTYEDRAIAIIADAGDSYLVVIGEKNSSITLTDLNGIPHKYDLRDYPEYALISKQDYWDCNPNYRPIYDEV